LRGGLPAVDTTDDLALFATTPQELLQLARTGESIFGKVLKGVGALRPVAGSPGQGRSEQSESGVRFVARFTDRTQAIVDATRTGIYVARARSGEPVGTALPGRQWSRFGTSVSSSSDGHLFAFRADTTSIIDSKAAPSAAIFLGSDAGMQVVARAGDPIPGEPASRFIAFSEPVLSPDGDCLAFQARFRSAGITDAGIFMLRGDSPLATVTTLTTPPPDVQPGAKWESFVSLASIGGGVGPVFYGLLEQSTRVTAANNAGVWGVNASGELRSIIREGDQIAAKQVKSIQVLNAPNGIPGGTRSFNWNQQLVWKATFTDQTSAIVLTTVP
jgi:hypothetical protein